MTGPIPTIPRDSLGYSIPLARDWCRVAGVEPAVGVLAVLLASEAENAVRYPNYARAIGEACLNAAKAIARPAKGKLPAEPLDAALIRRIVGDRRPEYDGRFGSQGGRWASTRQAPTSVHFTIAQLVWDGRTMPNVLARGATQWTDQRTQHVMHLRKPATNPSPEEVMSRRYKAGAKWVGPIDDPSGVQVIDPYLLTLLGPTGVDEAQAMAMLRAGRVKWHQELD